MFEGKTSMALQLLSQRCGILHVHDQLIVTHWLSLISWSQKIPRLSRPPGCCHIALLGYPWSPFCRFWLDWCKQYSLGCSLHKGCCWAFRYWCSLLEKALHLLQVCLSRSVPFSCSGCQKTMYIICRSKGSFCPTSLSSHCPGQVSRIRPIVICKTARRIVLKAVLQVTRADIQDAAGSLQLCASQIAGIEAAVRSMREDTKAVLLVDASNVLTP